MYLSKAFLEQYPNNPDWPSILGQFVYLRTYARFIDTLGRRETWKETVARVVEYTIGLDTISEHSEKVMEAEQLFEYMFKLKVFPAGRTLWTGGTEAAKKYPLSNFNCSFTIIKDFEAFTDAFYLMMLGTGVGFRVLPEDVATLPKLRTTPLIVEHEPYFSIGKEYRAESTHTRFNAANQCILSIGDSKEGWVDGLAQLLDAFTNEDISSVQINYDSVRPAGEVLKTFGGRASGHEALKNMYQKITDTLNEGISAGQFNISTLQAMDIMNLIGEAVVVGGVRRSSEITLFDINDESVLTAKQDLWSDLAKQSKRFRSMSNNSVFFKSKPTKEQLTKIFELISTNGEPGFINAEASAQRRKWYAGTNPCAEILLADKGVCNLSEVNVRAFVVQDPSGRNVLDVYDLQEAVQMATRIGVRMATLELELPKWNATQARDRLTGVSLTGYVEAMDAIGCDSTVSSSLVPDVHTDTRGAEAGRTSYGYTFSLESFLWHLRMVANVEAKKYATELRIAPPLLVTCVKPSGTIAQLPTVSSGAHASYAPYYIRRVRISSNDPLAKAMHAAKFTIFPEATYCDPAVFAALPELDKLDVLQRAATWVIEFPVKTSAVKPASAESALVQLSRYFILQREWADHNTSITINFSPDEVEGIVDYIHENWDDYIGVSFLPRFTTAYPLMPYEEIDEAEYLRRHAQIAHIDGDYITKTLSFYEHPVIIDEVLDADCEGGACPIR